MVLVQALLYSIFFQLKRGKTGNLPGFMHMVLYKNTTSPVFPSLPAQLTNPDWKGKLILYGRLVITKCAPSQRF